MRDITLKRIEKSPFFDMCYQPTFFDDPLFVKEKEELCRVYNDGGHFVAVPLRKRQGEKDYFRRKKQENSLREIFDELYNICMSEGMGKLKTSLFIQDNMAQYADYFDGANDEDNARNLCCFIDSNIKRRLHNFHVRKKRAWRKANLNEWNYFITITYDDKKQNEEDFRRRLRKSFSNFHSRRGWKYIGVFERAPITGRLHFHALLYVPDGQMIGEIIVKKDYSTKKHCMQEIHENTFFESTFGRNDFEEIKPLMRGECIGYIMKYLEKTGEKIIYSRGVPAEIYLKVGENDIISDIRNFVLKYVLFDNVVSWEKDIKNYVNPNIRGYEPRYIC